MTSRILCPECSAALRLSEAYLGKMVKCPRCSLTFTAPANRAEVSAETPPPRTTRRKYDDDDDEDDFDTKRHRPTSRTGLWIGLLSALCIGLVAIVGTLLLTRNRDNSASLAHVPPFSPPSIPQPETKAGQPQPFAPPPPEGNDPLEPFRGPQVPAPAEGERVRLSNPRYQRDGFGPFEKLCVDYQFNDGGGLGPRAGLVMILKSGNQLSQAPLFGIINNSGTIALDSFGMRRIPAGTQMWIAEGFGIGMGRFGAQPKRVSNVVVSP